jgi:hypothetical protein
MKDMIYVGYQRHYLGLENSEDEILEQRNKKAFSDTKSIRLATVQNGGLIIYTPKTASKCLLNYILYRTKKPTIGKMNTALNVLTTL